MKLWQVVIAGLLMATLPFVVACSAEKPYYSSDEVVVIIEQRLDLFNGSSPIEQDRYGARLVSKPFVANFTLDDWEAKYLGDGKWQVSALASYYYGLNKQTDKCVWYFYEKSDKIKYVGNGE